MIWFGEWILRLARKRPDIVVEPVVGTSHVGTIFFGEGVRVNVDHIVGTSHMSDIKIRVVEPFYSQYPLKVHVIPNTIKVRRATGQFGDVVCKPCKDKTYHSNDSFHGAHFFFSSEQCVCPTPQSDLFYHSNDSFFGAGTYFESGN